MNDEKILAAANNPERSATTLDKLLNDKFDRVRLAVLGNPRVSSKTLDRCLEDNRQARTYFEKGISKGSFENSDRLNTEIINCLAVAKDSQTLFFSLRNLSCDRLLYNRESYVAELATHKLNLPSA